MPRTKAKKAVKTEVVVIPEPEPVVEEPVVEQEEEPIVEESTETEAVEEAAEGQEIKPRKQKKVFDMVSYHRAYRNSEKWREYISNYNQVNKEHINELKKKAAKQKQELKLYVKDAIINKQIKFENEGMLNHVLELIKLKISAEETNQLVF